MAREVTDTALHKVWPRDPWAGASDGQWSVRAVAEPDAHWQGGVPHPSSCSWRNESIPTALGYKGPRLEICSPTSIPDPVPLPGGQEARKLMSLCPSSSLAVKRAGLNLCHIGEVPEEGVHKGKTVRGGECCPNSCSPSNHGREGCRGGSHLRSTRHKHEDKNPKC